MKKLTLLCFAFLMTAGAYAQSPEGVSYQTILRNGAGDLLVNTSATLGIAVLQGSATGTVVYDETHSVTSNGYGLVNVTIGQGTAVTGSFAGIDWSAGPYFARTSVDGQPLGTSQLLSVPYALYAAESGSSIPGPQGPQGATGPAGPQGPQGAMGLQGPAGADGSGVNILGSLPNVGSLPATGSSGDAYLINGDLHVWSSTTSTWVNVGTIQGPQGVAGPAGPQGPAGATGPAGAQGPQGTTGAPGPQGPMGVAGNDGATGPAGAQGPQGVPGPQGPAGAANINGTTNQLIKFTGATTGENSQIFDDGSNVGIGTSIPATDFHVLGNTKIVDYPLNQPAIPDAILELETNTGTMVMPRISEGARDVISPVPGMIMYNKSTGKFQGYAENSSCAMISSMIGGGFVGVVDGPAPWPGDVALLYQTFQAPSTFQLDSIVFWTLGTSPGGGVNVTLGSGIPGVTITAMIESWTVANVAANSAVGLSVTTTPVLSANQDYYLYFSPIGPVPINVELEAGGNAIPAGTALSQPGGSAVFIDQNKDLKFQMISKGTPGWVDLH